MTAGRVLRLLCLAGAASMGVVAASASAAPLYPTPDPDPFYAAPANLADYRPGDVIDVRVMPALPSFPATTVTMVKFRSTNSRGGPIAATTTVLTPQEHRADGPLLSFQHIINALGTECSVSRMLYTANLKRVFWDAPALNIALRKGWSVALPDHLGPQAAYGAARLGGLITLDGIRAAQRVPELGLANSPAVMAGYSGGGMATAWAAALAPAYAPELQLAGAAAGGVPMNLVTMVKAVGMQPHPAFGLAMAAAIGLEREYPDRLPISSHLNARGLAARDAMADGCTNDIMAIGAGRSVRDFAASTSMIESREAWAVLEENSLELFDGVPNMPIFEWHSATDPLIPVDAVINANRRYCAAGVRLQAELTGSPEHLSAAVLGVPAALAWLDARFRGEPAPSNC